MTVVQFKDSTSQITLGDAIELYEVGICTVVTDGRDVTFEIETVSTSEESTRRN